MKNVNYLWFLVVACVALAGCKSKPIRPVGADNPSDYIGFRLYANNQHFSGATISFTGESCLTDKSGYCKLPRPKSAVGEEGTVRIVHPDYAVDTSFTIMIREENALAILLMSGNKTLMQPLVDLRKNDISGIQDKLVDAEMLLDEIEEDLKVYLHTHPYSAVDGYRGVLDLRRQELLLLKENARTLLDRYSNVLENLDENEIVNIQEDEGVFLSLKRSFDHFMSKTYATDFALGKNLAVHPDLEENTDIFFDLGEYKIHNLTPEQARKLEVFIDKIRQLEKKYSGFNKADLVLEIKSVGFTDGVPVGGALHQEIAQQCYADQFDFHDSNKCLSYLRAREIINIVLNSVSDLSPVVYITGLGDREAGGSPEPNAQIRKCHLSFTLMELKIKS